MLECYYLVLIIILIYLIYTNCTKVVQDDFVSDNTSKILLRGMGLPNVDKDTPYTSSLGSAIPDPGEGKREWEKCDTIFFPKCPSGYHTLGCNLCEEEKQPIPRDAILKVVPQEEKNELDTLVEKILKNKYNQSDAVRYNELSIIDRYGKDTCVGSVTYPMPSKACFKRSCKGPSCAPYVKEDIELNIPIRTKIRECITGNEDTCHRLPCYGDLEKCAENNHFLKRHLDNTPYHYDKLVNLHNLVTAYNNDKVKKTAQLRINIPSWRNKRKKAGLKWKRNMVPYEKYP